MNSDMNTPGVQPESTQNTQSFTRPTFDSSVSASGVGAVAPSSPIPLSELPSRHARPVILHFVTLKTVMLMIAAWLVVIAGISTFIHMNPKAKMSQANVPSPTALVSPLNPEEEQKNDVNKINDRLVEYYAKFGTYPSVSQINSGPFRAGDPSFVKIGRKIYIDPFGSSVELATKPTKGQYHYIPTPSNCDSSQIMCSGYTLGATLASGELYNVQSAK